MKKKTCKSIAIIFIVYLCVSLVACGGKSIVGIWETEIDGQIGTFEFTRDKSFITTVDDETTMEGSYNIEGNKLILTWHNDSVEECYFEINDDKLTLIFDYDPAHPEGTATREFSRK